MSGWLRKRDKRIGTDDSARAVRAATNRFMGIGGVVSVGLGMDEDGSPRIEVGLDRPVSEVRSALPGDVDGVPVRLIHIGGISADERGKAR